MTNDEPQGAGGVFADALAAHDEMFLMLDDHFSEQAWIYDVDGDAVYGPIVRESIEPARAAFPLLVAMYRKGHSNGHRRGRASLQAELRALLDVPAVERLP